MPPKKSDRSNSTGFPLGFEGTAIRESAPQINPADLRSLSAAEYMQSGDRYLRVASSAGDASPYKHVTPGPVFRKDISDGVLLLA